VTVMNCSDISELAPLYLAGEMDRDRAAQFDSHLKTCSECFRELETQARLDARLREILLAEEADVSRVNRRVRELLATDTLAEAVRQVEQARRARRRWVTAAMGIAAAVLLLVSSYLAFPGKASQVYADAAEDHQMEVVDHGPRSWTSDPAQIAALARKLGVDIAVPATLSSGFRLEHAKICGLDGRAYLHVVYTDGTREFSLFLRTRDSENFNAAIRGLSNGRLLRECASGKEHVTSFVTPHLNAVVATDQPSAASLAYARLASAAIQD